MFPSKDTFSDKNLYIYNRKNEPNKIKDGLTGGENLILSELLCGTTAAPTYFPSKEMKINGINHNLIDSGVIVNDPSEIAFLEAENIFKLDSNNIYELSVGTGKVDKRYNSLFWGMLQWVRPIAGLLIESNSENQEYELSLIADNSAYDRLNPLIPNSIDYLDQPKYIDQYIEITEEYIINNSDLIDKIVGKLLKNCK